MSDNLHCHETARCVELLNEHSDTMRINYFLVRDSDDEDRVPVVDIEIQGVSSVAESFRLCSREDCDKVIEALIEVTQAAFPKP